MFSWIVALALYVIVGQSNPAMALADLNLMSRSFLPLASDTMTAEIAGPTKKDPTRLGIKTESRAAVIVDWDSEQVLMRKNAEWPLPIASITKLMTALVVLDSGLPLDTPVTIQSADIRTGGIPYVIPGEEILAGDLLHASLIASANTATMSLARATGLTDEEFVSRMNSLGQEIGLRETTFIEPTGLDANNISPASDVALLVKQALGSKTISEIARLERYEFDALTGLRHVISSTDDLLGSSISKPPYTFMGGKTGYIIEAGYCFAAAAENGQGNRVIAVVLGAPSKEVRFAEVSSLLYWAFDAFMWD